MAKKLESYNSYQDHTSIQYNKRLDTQATEVQSSTAPQRTSCHYTVLRVLYSAAVLPVVSVQRVMSVFFFSLAFCYYLCFCHTALPAQDVKLPHSVTALSVNAHDTVIAVSDSASIATYNTAGYTLISAIPEDTIARSLFYQEQNAEFLIAMTHAGKFLLYRPSSTGKKTYTKTEEYMLSNYAEGKPVTCNAFSRHTNYSAAAFEDFSIQIHFKLRFI